MLKQNASIALLSAVTFSLSGCLAPVDQGGSNGASDEVGEAASAIAGTGDCVFTDTLRGALVTTGVTETACRTSCQSSFETMSTDALAQDCVWNYSNGTKVEIAASSRGACYVPYYYGLMAVPVGSLVTTSDGVVHVPFENGLTKATCSQRCLAQSGCTWRNDETGAFKNAPTNDEAFISHYAQGQAYPHQYIFQGVTTQSQAYTHCRGVYSTIPYWDGASDCVWVENSVGTVVIAASSMGACQVVKNGTSTYTNGQLQSECVSTCTAAAADECRWWSYTHNVIQIW